jgi:CRISPR-associated protein Cpf1
MQHFEKFTNQYQLSKTLRFELKPVGNTLDNIQKKDLISKDNLRAQSYAEMKKTIDQFHKYFIEIALKNANLSDLIEFEALYNENVENKKDDNYKKKFDKIKENLRKDIVKLFNEGEAKEIYSKLFQKELITEELEKWISEEKDIYFDGGFKNFTTYFSGFHENRKNIYTSEANSTGIAYRLIHENLPKYIDNLKVFKKLYAIEEFKPKLDILYNNFKEYLDVVDLNKVFELSYYNKLLTQKGIEIYNHIIGGRVDNEEDKKIQGINEIINLYNQTKDKKDRLPKLKQLYKQILSDRISLSFLPPAFKKDYEVIKAINDFYISNLTSFIPEGNNTAENILAQIKSVVTNLKSFDLNKIFLRNDTNITNISQKCFGDYSIISSALDWYFESYIDPDFSTKYAKAKDQLAQEKLDKIKWKYTKQEYISINELQTVLSKYTKTLDNVALKFDENIISNYFNIFFVANKTDKSDKDFDLVSNITVKYQCIQGILNNSIEMEDELKQNQKLIDDIKLFLDAILELLHFIKPLHLKSENITDKDADFYNVFDVLFEQLNLITPLYNMVRNYVTQKPYSTEKIKLNFDNAQLLNGWDANKESDYLTVILRKEGLYYLAIMDKKNNKAFINYSAGNKNYEKLVYKLLPGANKNLPRVFFAEKNINYYKPSEELLKNYKNNTHKKGDTFNIEHCHELINFFKDSINKHEDWKNFNFKFSDTNSYEDLSGFYREVEHQGYKIHFENIDENYINELLNKGELYLFQIYNKDFSAASKGKHNLHTIYWKALFDESNLKNVFYKLNGQAEIFFRKKSIKEQHIVTHKANIAIPAKNPNTPKNSNTFTFDLIKDKRYTIDKFQFHVPITLNFKASGGNYFNQNVLQYLKNNPDIKIIGLDRGERHLIYLSLIDQNGNILHQESLNTISSSNFPSETPYHTLLDNKEKEREKARTNWGTIENIKNLKEGYISQVVHKIASMMVEHNAIVVMEDLNFGFKRGRFKVEKQIYQKLEKMLIDKLNYLVLKDKNPNELGGTYNALQLTNKFESFQKLGKQSGFLFYVPAWNTSKIDPVTGFVNLFNLRYENIEKTKSIFKKFKRIEYNTAKKHFEFEFDYSDFTEKAKGTKTNWVICSHGNRILTFRNTEKANQWDNKEIDLTENFKYFFEQHNIDIHQNLQNAILEQTDKSFFEVLLHNMKLVLQMRNSVTNSDVDYLISPVADNNGNFFDSRKGGNTLPKDADANGAYHIAKKGLWVLKEINKTDDLKKIKLAISNIDWLKFVQG